MGKVSEDRFGDMVGWILKRWWVLALAALCACSAQTDTAGGNSAESGNPEIAGNIFLRSGSPAAAHVRCVPLDFDSHHDTLDSFRTVRTDSLGRYTFRGLPTGRCNLEALDTLTGEVLFAKGLEVDSSATLTRTDTLGPTATLRIGVPTLSDGDSGTVLIPGSTYRRRVMVKFGSLYVDSLPVAQYDSLRFIADQGGVPVILDSLPMPVAGDTVAVRAAPIHWSVKIALDTRTGAANLSDTLFGFPLALRFGAFRGDLTIVDPGRGRMQVLSGDSSRILASDVAFWTEKQGVLWVRIDTLLPQTSGQSLLVVWDEGQSAKSDDPVFLASDGFLAAWHFDEGAGQISDAGPNGLQGIPLNLIADSGQVGGALYFDGRTSGIEIPGSATGPLDLAYNNTSTFTVWARLDAPNTSRYVFGKGPSQYYLKYFHPYQWLFETVEEQDTTMRGWYLAPFDSVAGAGRWSMLSVVQDNGKAMLYADAQLMDSAAAWGYAPDKRSTTGSFQIGRRVDSLGVVGQIFQGALDELHVSGVARSPAWLHMVWVNQNPASRWP